MVTYGTRTRKDTYLTFLYYYLNIKNLSKRGEDLGIVLKKVIMGKYINFNKTSIVLVFLLFILASPIQFAFSSIKSNSNRLQTPVHQHAGMLLPKNQSFSGSDSSGLNYDEQISETFTQSFTSMAYNVTAVDQVDSDGYGPSYLLNGLSNMGYWYQVGLSYDWPEHSGISSMAWPGFSFSYEVFDPAGKSIFPPTVVEETSASQVQSMLVILFFSICISEQAPTRGRL